MHKYDHLFQPIKIGKREVKNRVFMPPISTNLANKGYVTEELIQHYGARAKGGVGLIVSEKYKSPVRCVFSDQVLLLRTNTTIGAAEDRCPIAGSGKELEIGFNVRYLADALRAIPSEEVVLELTNGLSPIVLTPADKKYDFSYMVLPVRIKNG